MGFGDLETHDGLVLLDAYLLDRSYIEGYCPSQHDVVVFEAVKTSPPTDLINASRWYRHIASFSDEERQKFKGSRQSIEHYGGRCDGEKHELKIPSLVPIETDVSYKAQDSEGEFDPFADDDSIETGQRVKKSIVTSGSRNSEIAASKEIAKSRIVLDIKVWDDQTNMNELEKLVRSIEMDGLVMGASCLVPVISPIYKLQITCIVEDDKVSVYDLEDHIMEFQDHVQSVDVAWFEKI